MGKYVDIKNQRFGKLIAIKDVGRRRGRVLWLFNCDCGNQTFVTSNDVLTGNTKTCGCSHGEKHGFCGKERLYSIWQDVKKRCLNKNHCRYKNYGGRGITVCNEWKKSYLAFRTWALNNGYKEELTIDRINNDGNYEPKNCRWATIIEQANNRSNNHLIKYKGKEKTIAQWARKLNMKYSTFAGRIRIGWKIQEIIKTTKEK